MRVAGGPQTPERMTLNDVEMVQKIEKENSELKKRVAALRNLNRNMVERLARINRCIRKAGIGA
ncbi:hypothetical protein MTAT_26330 [Moorella thermoacetica]|uniref:Uncharacterized protein n=1 Tax=Neomoorella thermoacetica TaxID=1525 RepID=A0AAC9HFU3_NEOTH|nr:hypothetical protein Maut_00601 [Moorella thermoacetica]TYL08969.1 hypothetical protein MTAT_26330 [Moorella thermoacetica]